MEPPGSQQPFDAETQSILDEMGSAVTPEKAAKLVGRLMEKAARVAPNPTPGVPPAALTMEDVIEQNKLLKEQLDKKDREATQRELEHRVATLYPDATKHAEVSNGIQTRCGSDIGSLKAASDVVQLIIAAGGVGAEGSFRPTGLKRKAEDTGTVAAPTTEAGYYKACMSYYSNQRIKVTDGRTTVAETSYTV